MTNKKSVEIIDKMIDIWWILRNKSKITKSEKELVAKVKSFKKGNKLEGLTLKEYLAETGREWGDKFIKTAESEERKWQRL